LWALMVGNFVIGSGVMVVPGTLNEISASLRVSTPVAGQLIAAAAVVMGVGAPTLAAVVARWDRRGLLALSMLWFAFWTLACGFADDFQTLMLCRVLAVVAPAVFTPQAAACVGLLVPAEQRGRAITFVFLGWSFASVIGMPVGAWLAGALGWRWAFFAVSALALVSAVWVWRTLPVGIRPMALPLAAWRQTLRSPLLMAVVAVTLLSSFGQFVLSSYFAPYFKAVLGASASQLGSLLFCFGGFGLLGNLFMTRHIDRFGSATAVTASLAGIALSLLLWPLGTTLHLAVWVMMPWALGCFASNSAQQARLAGAAPALAGATIALNTSAMYAGQALGAGSGGWMIAHGLMGDLHGLGFAIVLLAVATSIVAARLSQGPRGV